MKTHAGFDMHKGPLWKKQKSQSSRDTNPIAQSSSCVVPMLVYLYIAIDRSFFTFIYSAADIGSRAFQCSLISLTNDPRAQSEGTSTHRSCVSRYRRLLVIVHAKISIQTRILQACIAHHTMPSGTALKPCNQITSLPSLCFSTSSLLLSYFRFSHAAKPTSTVASNKYDPAQYPTAGMPYRWTRVPAIGGPVKQVTAQDAHIIPIHVPSDCLFSSGII